MPHTPGPFVLRDHCPSQYGDPRYVKSILGEGGEGVQVASVMMDIGGGEDAANANLFLASPDLLASAEECVAFVLVHCSQYARQHGLSSSIAPMPDEWHPTHRAIYERLTSAIAKAKGEVGADPQGKGGRDA